jgi:hypothetical protein
MSIESICIYNPKGAKLGNKFPVAGNPLRKPQLDTPESAYEQAIAQALQRELRGSQRALKTLMRWTGASERSAKNWYTGASGPNGANLVALMRHSNAVYETVLRLARRYDERSGDQADAIRARLTESLSLLQELDKAG